MNNGKSSNAAVFFRPKKSIGSLAKPERQSAAESGKASCHSDLVTAAEAQQIQIVQLGGG
jgi:hypothetical protein